MKYCDLYKSLKNPLYDNEILEDIVDTYSNSSNFSEDILKVNSKNDYSVFGDDLEDKNIFYSRLFALWKITLNNIFARGNLTHKERIGFLKFYSYLDSYRFDTADNILKHIKKIGFHAGKGLCVWKNIWLIAESAPAVSAKFIFARE